MVRFALLFPWSLMLYGVLCCTKWGLLTLVSRPATVTDFSRNEARAAQQSKLCKWRVTMSWVGIRPVPPGCARKNAGVALQSLAICPALRALPSRFFVQQREREASINRP